MHRNITLRIVSLLLVAIFVLVNTHGVVGNSEPYQHYDNTDEKILCNAKLEDDFADDAVIVVLNTKASTALDINKSSVSLKWYNPDDFIEFNCLSVDDLTMYTAQQLNEKIATVDSKGLSGIDGVVTAYDLGIDIQKFNRILRLELEKQSKENVLYVIKQLEKMDNILYAGPDYFISIDYTPPSGVYAAQQWALDNIDLPDAWDITTGSSTVTIGVIDSGIQWNHPDLANQVEAGNRHRDFSNGLSEIVFTPTDWYGHGTFVAGVIGANGTGVSGVCNDINLISLQVWNSSGKGRSSYVERAINYATSIDIPILNFSGGWSSTNPNYDVALATSINNFPGLFVCSAGNDNYNNGLTPHYPANYRLDNLISVGAIQNTISNGHNERWFEHVYSGSNFGAQSVDIFAPGGAILSTYPIDLYSLDDPNHHIAVGYLIGNGTSAATPYVAGVAALLLAKYPSYSAFDLKRVIMQTGTTNANLSGQCTSGKQLNAYAALGSHVTVKSGYDVATGTGSYSSGATVTIKAGTRFGYTFSHWTVNVGGVTLANFYSATTTFSKPSNTNVVVTANWNSDPCFDGYFLFDGEIGAGDKLFTFLGSDVETGNTFNVYAPKASQIYVYGPWLNMNGGDFVAAPIWWWGDPSTYWIAEIQGTWNSWGVVQIWVEN